MSDFSAEGVAGRYSIIIPNWNGQHFLTVCLNALRAQSYSDIEVIIVDNASSDGSQAFIEENYPEITLIRLSENRGFAPACNIGMQAATGEFICLLNNDTEVMPTWVEEVIGAFGRHPQAGMVASRMMLFDKRDHFHTTGDFFRVDGQAGNRGVWQKDEGQFEEEDYIFSACGGSSAYRRAMLADIGLLDEDFFFSGEDVDLGWRAQLAGYRCVYAPRAVVCVSYAFSDGWRGHIQLLRWAE